MTEPKKKYTRIQSSRLVIDPGTHIMFKDYCKDLDIEMKEAVNEVLLFVIKNKIPIDKLQDMMDNSLTVAITKEVRRTHNYTAGFLQQFEQRILELIPRHIKKPTDKDLEQSQIIKIIVQELYEDIEFLMEKNQDKEFAPQYLKRNKDNIEKAFIEGNVWEKDGIMRVKLNEILRDIQFLMRQTSDRRVADKLIAQNNFNIKNAEDDNET
jgi:hypothetical protein